MQPETIKTGVRQPKLSMSTTHPLDPLTAEEIAFVRESILSAPEHAVMPRGARVITVGEMEDYPATAAALADALFEGGRRDTP